MAVIEESAPARGAAAGRNRVILVKGSRITVSARHEQDYISLTDMVRPFEGGGVLIENWLRSKDTVLFLGVWEQLNNGHFNSLEFEGIRKEAGRNSYFLSIKKWIASTGAIGLDARAGRYGGTFAHRDIAFEFGSWLSPEFKLYLIKEFQRLKDEESRAAAVPWNFQRMLAKVNYKIHTDAIKEVLIPARVTPQQVSAIYATEADLLNVAIFGRTAEEWRRSNRGKIGNMRDEASLEHLVVLSNLESINAMLIHQGMSTSERLKRLNGIAIGQMRSQVDSRAVRKLKGVI